jgi:acyl carrier protein
MEVEEIVVRVLGAANRAAGTSLSIPVGGDVPIDDFHLDSLGLFAFMAELESSCAIRLDDALEGYDQLQSIRSTARAIHSWLTCRDQELK